MKKVTGIKGMWKVLVPLCLALVMSFSFVGCIAPDGGGNGGGGGGGNVTSKALAGFVSVDINPSIEFTTDDAGLVTAVRAANEDARVLLSDMKLVGLKLEEAVKLTTAAAEAAGYLKETNKKVKISAVAADETASKDLGKEATKGATSGSDIAQVTEESKKALERKVAKLKEKDAELYKDMTAAKLRIIETIIEYDAKFTVENGAKLTIKELTTMAKELYEKFEDMVSDDLEDKFDLAVDAATWIIDAQINAVYGLAYAAKALTLHTVELLEDKIEKILEEVEISADDVATLVTSFKLENSDALKIDGKITLESIEAYIETVEDKWDDMTSEEDEAMKVTFDAVEELLKKYDEDSAQLSQAILDEIKKAVGSAIVDSLDALETYADELEKTLDTQKEEIEKTLTSAQKDKINELEKKKDTIENDAKKGLQKEIDAAKATLKAAKAAKIEANKKQA